MDPIPTQIRPHSPTKTAGGGATGEEKVSRGSGGGGMRKVNEASITAKTQARLSLRGKSETNPASGSNNPIVMKKAANTGVRSSCIRGSTPNGVKRKPRTKPSPNKTASIPCALLNDAIVLANEVISYSALALGATIG